MLKPIGIIAVEPETADTTVGVVYWGCADYAMLASDFPFPALICPELTGLTT